MVDMSAMADPSLKNEKLAEELVAAEERVEVIDYVAEKRLVRKFDRHIIPILMLLYLLSFLDR